MSILTTVSRIGQDPATFVREHSTALRTFDHRTQDSGNVSWLVESAGERLFVKTAGTTGPPVPGAPVQIVTTQHRRTSGWLTFRQRPCSLCSTR